MMPLRTVGRLSALFSALVMLAVSTAAIAGEGGVPLPQLSQAQGEQCVEETAFMRRNHMDLLKHQRNETMRKGIRTEKYSLTGCINCHVTRGEDGQYASIESREHFCSSCHTYAGVRLDCFECHTSQPDADAVASNR